jgi:low affinity Fe/Cu permease
MELGFAGIIVAIIIAILLIKIIKFGLKIVLFFILAIVVSITLWICFAQPDMHEPFSVNTIEYLFKIDKRTKQVLLGKVYDIKLNFHQNAKVHEIFDSIINYLNE